MSKDKLFKNINLESFFEKWYEEKRSSDNFESYIGFSDEDKENLEESSIEDFEIEHFPKKAKKNKKDFKNYLGNILEEEKKSKAADWYWDRIDDFTRDFMNKVNVTEKGIMSFRSIMVKDVTEFMHHLSEGKVLKGFDGIGTCWAWDEDRAEAHWGDGKQEVILTGLLPFSAIDKEVTLMLNLDPSLGQDEAEIRVKEGKYVYIFKVNEEEIEPIKIKA